MEGFLRFSKQPSGGAEPSLEWMTMIIDQAGTILMALCLQSQKHTPHI
jgi:hypothetical protein